MFFNNFSASLAHSGLNAASYHWVNVALHALVTLCLASFARPFVRHPVARAFAGLAFAAHPIHCEAVASVVGRAELGAALHTLVALLAYRAYLRARSEPTSKREASRLALLKKESISSRGKTRPLSQLVRRLAICCWCPDAERYASAGDAPEGRSSPVLLGASLLAGASALLWKETGLAALPLCALLEWLDATRSGRRAERQVIEAALRLGNRIAFQKRRLAPANKTLPVDAWLTLSERRRY